ncbi:hypothetical protein [Catellatospora paridis]|uniref:hypothetical protein n=1 Tax=Catellatospora paridis TaxID=1617086 RepID=UPI0012D3DCE6|nr:hypothetical protein [Catellatospora paridis]
MPADVQLHQEVHVCYGQIYVESRNARLDGDLSHSFRGQVNGLCGAAIPGTLFLMTGTHTGRVGFTVALHRREPPPPDESWEDAVEASFRTDGTELGLAEWGGAGWYPLHLPDGDYRVRYCGRGMAQGQQGGMPQDGEPPHDSYLLQFWPAPPAADRVLRETTAQAAYWHEHARSLPPPPTPDELAEKARLERLEQERRQADRRAAADRRRWGDRVPNDRLRRVQGNVLGMEKLDLELVFAVAEADTRTQRAVARWAAEKAYATAGLSELPWVVPALAALRDGRPLPPPFDDPLALWPRLNGMPITTVRSYDGRHEHVSQQHMAVPALLGAMEPDSLQAALDALFAAAVTHGDGYRALLADARKAFPQLRTGAR